MPPMTAPRARRLLARLDRDAEQRQRFLGEIHSRLDQSEVLLVWPKFDPGDAAPFLLVCCANDQADHGSNAAARDGVTQRRCWPAYQQLEPSQQTHGVLWLAECLLILELHWRLNVGETERVAKTLNRLAADLDAC